MAYCLYCYHQPTVSHAYTHMHIIRLLNVRLDYAELVYGCLISKYYILLSRFQIGRSDSDFLYAILSSPGT
jgi:hypothetical protein